tara:strand:+ start:75 stop:491 length:417 start_codon:yes stop_codon:yes gene_type:complete
MKTRDKIIELHYIRKRLVEIRDDLLEVLDETDNDKKAVEIGKHINALTVFTNVLTNNIELYVEEFKITQKQADKFEFKESNTYKIYQQHSNGFKVKQELIDLSNKYFKAIRVELNKKLNKKGEELIPENVKIDGTYQE